MAFLNALSISGSGMTAQRMRLDIAAQNIANIETTRTEDGSSYQRKMVVLEEKNSFKNVLSKALENDNKGVVVSRIVEDQTELELVYNPEHPDANEEGYVAMPNVDLIKEMADAMAATRAYEANITVFNSVKLMAQKALEIGK